MPPSEAGARFQHFLKPGRQIGILDGLVHRVTVTGTTMTGWESQRQKTEKEREAHHFGPPFNRDHFTGMASHDYRQ